MEEGGAAGASATELAVLRVKLEAAQAKIADMDRERRIILETVDDLRTRLDRAEDRILALVHRPVAAPAPALAEKPAEALTAAPVVAEPVRPSRSFLARLLGL